METTQAGHEPIDKKMARIQEDIITIKVSRLFRDSETDSGPLMPDDTIASLEQVIGELAGKECLVEVQKHEEHE